MNNESNLQARPAEIKGEASVIRAKPAVLKAEISITRAATGAVEHYTITGTVPDQPKEPE